MMLANKFKGVCFCDTVYVYAESCSEQVLIGKE